MNLTYYWDIHHKAYIIGIAGTKESEIKYAYTKKALDKVLSELETKYSTIAKKSAYKPTLESRLGEKVRDNGFAYTIEYANGMYYAISREGFIFAEDTSYKRIRRKIYS